LTCGNHTFHIPLNYIIFWGLSESQLAKSKASMKRAPSRDQVMDVMCSSSKSDDFSLDYTLYPKRWKALCAFVFESSVIFTLL
jgi:hypothetical protein